MEPVRVGVIGVGGHTRQMLLPAMAQAPEALEPVLLATAHAESARAMGARYRLPAVVGHEAVLGDPSVDAVLIASHDHERQAIDALHAGKHVFCETPGITTRAGAARIRQLARDTGLVYQVGSCLRYAPIYQSMQRQLAAWRDAAPGPRTTSIRYYPYIGHFQNLLLYLNGPVAQVMDLRHADGSGAVSLYRFANGDLASISWCAFHHVALPYEAVEITHPSGRLLAEDGRTLRFDHTPPERSTSPYDLHFALTHAELEGTTFSIPYGQNNQLYLRGYTPELADFARCIRDGAAPRCGVDDAEATLLIGQAAARSVEAGGMWAPVKG